MAALLAFGVAPAKALEDYQTKNIATAIADASILELAPKAAEIVRNADEKDRKEVAVLVVGLVVSKTPNLVLSLVEQIVKVAPETAPAVAAAASEMVPGRMHAILRIAASYAPDRASQVAAEVSKVSPQSAVHIAKRVVGIVPEETHRVLEAIVVAVPSARQQIESDATLNIVSVFSRTFDTSASSEVRRFRGASIVRRLVFGRETSNPSTTPPVQVSNDTVTNEPQSAELQALVLAVSEDDPNLNAATASAVAVSIVNLANDIVFSPQSAGTTKQEDNTALDLVSTFVAKTKATAANSTDATARNDFTRQVVEQATSSLSETFSSATDETKSAAFSAVIDGADSALQAVADKAAAGGTITANDLTEASNDSQATAKAISAVVVAASAKTGGTAADFQTTLNDAVTAIKKVAKETTGAAGTSALSAVADAAATVAGDDQIDSATATVLLNFVADETVKASVDIAADTTVTSPESKENALGAVVAAIAKATKEIVQEAKDAGLSGEQIAAQVTVKVQQVADEAQQIKGAYGSP